MTQAQQEADLQIARGILECLPSGSAYNIDRCRHNIVTETALWIFNSQGVQIGSISSLGRSPRRWKTNRIHRGLPISEKNFAILEEALEHILEGG